MRFSFSRRFPRRVKDGFFIWPQFMGIEVFFSPGVEALDFAGDAYPIPEPWKQQLSMVTDKTCFMLTPQLRARKRLVDAGILDIATFADAVLTGNREGVDALELIASPGYLPLEEILKAEWYQAHSPPLPFAEAESITQEELLQHWEYWRNLHAIEGLYLRAKGTTERVHAKPELHRAMCRIKKINWQTLSSGKVYPFAVPESLKGKQAVFHAKGQKSMGLALLPLVSPQHIRENQLGVGAEVGAMICPWSNMPIVEWVEEGVAIEPSPTKCPSCDSTALEEDPNGSLFCANWYCYAKSRTPIFHLCRMAGSSELGAFDLKCIDRWLSHFPTPAAPATIQTIYEFFALYHQAGPKDTAARAEMLMRELGTPIPNKIERAIETFLAGGLTYWQFWLISGIPGMGPEMARLLREVDPRKLTTENNFTSPELQGVMADVSKVVTSSGRWWNHLKGLVKFKEEVHA